MTEWNSVLISEDPRRELLNPVQGSVADGHPWNSQRIKTPEMPFSCDRQEQILFVVAINVDTA